MSLTDVWPDWGSQGEQPEDGSEYDPGDNVKAQTLNHLWYQLRETFSDVETEITSVEGDLDDHVTDTTNPHKVDADQVGAPTTPVTSSEIDADAIGTSELDLSITPTWTGEHTFENGLNVTGDTFKLTNTNLDANDNAITNASSVNTDGAEIASSLGIPVYTDDANAPNGTQYFDDTDGQLEFKDADGVIFAGGGLEDGENFDGQGTSEFTNLSSVSTEVIDINRSWQDVESSRELNVTETNITGGEIEVNVILQADSDNTVIGANWQGDVAESDEIRLNVDSGERVAIRTTVPDGADYIANTFGDDGDFSLLRWRELRA